MPALSRKTVTVLFADVVDYTPLGESVDAEQVRVVMSRYFAEMRTVIERHGGSVEKYIGDAIMAVFGIPTVHEDDALRAVRAAHDMREALAELNRELPDQLSIRTGLATGEVVTGEGDTLVTGDTVNIAARLEQAAATGEILIAESTRQLVRDAIVAEPVEPLVLKGKKEPVAAWRVTEVHANTPGRARRFDSVIVGREDELALLRQAYVRALASRGCHLFTVLGPAGVGKTRLGREFLATLEDKAALLVGRCLPYGEGITFWPLREVVYTLGDVRRYVNETDAGVLETAVGTGDLPAAPEETSRAVRRLLESVAREWPLVLVFEDIHWGAPAMLDLIDHIASAARDAPILLLCLARPELLDERPSWGGGKTNATTILLEPLDVDQADQLIANLAGDTLDDARRQAITEAAEGNPLFLEELVAMVFDEEAPSAVPPTINALLTARLELLPDEERATLAVASVVGRFFSADAVVAVAGEGARASLESLGQKDIIRTQRVAFTEGDAYRFRHILIRDAAYEGLSKAERAELHGRVAGWLEDSGPRREVDELVGWHLERAFTLRRDLGVADEELARRAYESLARVGRRALSRGDVTTAAALLGRAIALPGEDDNERIVVQLDLVAALLDQGHLSRAEELVEVAIDRARALGEEALVARALVERSHLLFHSDPEIWVQTARATATEAQSPLERAEDEIGLGRAWMLVVIHDYIQGHNRNLPAGIERALLHARRGGDRRHIQTLLTLAALSVVFDALPVDEAIERCDALVLEGADQSIVLGARACLHAMAARFELARADYSAGRALLEEFGRTRPVAVNAVYGGMVELWAGNARAAEVELGRAARTLETIGDHGTLSTVSLLIAAALEAQGRRHEALQWADVGRRDASTADIVSQVHWRTTLARLVPERSVELAEKAVAVAEQTDLTVLQADAALCLRDVLLASGRNEEAAQAGAQAAALYRAKGHVVGLQWVDSPSLTAISTSTTGDVAGGM
jgi:class 3 adenylate cyclase/tetratricopeptide (TPR) repeat protein